MERAHILAILDSSGWNITRAARTLEVDRMTLYNKIRKYQLQRPGHGPRGEPRAIETLWLVALGPLAPGLGVELATRLSRRMRAASRLTGRRPQAGATPAPGPRPGGRGRAAGAAGSPTRGSGHRRAGVNALDLAIPIFTFVFGRARSPGQAAFVSTARLDPIFYGLPTDPERTPAGPPTRSSTGWATSRASTTATIRPASCDSPGRWSTWTPEARRSAPAAPLASRTGSADARRNPCGTSAGLAYFLRTPPRAGPAGACSRRHPDCIPSLDTDESTRAVSTSRRAIVAVRSTWHELPRPFHACSGRGPDGGS